MLWLCGCPPAPPVGPPEVGLQLVADGLTAPVDLQFAPDDSGRMFVVTQVGQILILDRSGAKLETPFLDLRDRVVTLNPRYDERGLLGLAFHPDFAANGRFFVFYNAPPAADSPVETDSFIRVSEFRASSADADLADRASERILLSLEKRQSNHNGGQLAFGPDSYLYIAIGDGGGAGDQGDGHTGDIGNAQDKRKLFGKILRIDVDGGAPYAIPPDNPFAADPAARPEIYAYGLRNPWRFSFDLPPGGRTRLFAGDVGQALFEEVNLIEAGGNYGWRIREGGSCFNTSNFNVPRGSCSDLGADGAPLIFPILEYGRDRGQSVIGGYVYRGSAIPPLRGKYVFGDLSASLLTADGRLFVAAEAADGTWSFDELRIAGRSNGSLGRYLYAFGRDPAGELYVLTNTTNNPTGAGGALFKLVPP